MSLRYPAFLLWGLGFFVRNKLNLIYIFLKFSLKVFMLWPLTFSVGEESQAN